MDGSGIANAQYYIATTAARADDRARVLKYGRIFYVFEIGPDAFEIRSDIWSRFGEFSGGV